MVGDDPMTAEETDVTIEWAVYTETETEPCGDGCCTCTQNLAEPNRFYSSDEDYYWNDELQTPFTKAVMEAWVNGEIVNE